jgi:hypothetical protein
MSQTSFRVIYAGPPSALKLKHYEHWKIKITFDPRSMIRGY